MTIRQLDHADIKAMCRRLGADLTGIASSNHFTDAPQGYHPMDVLSTCRSVVVMACIFPEDSLSLDAVAYTHTRNAMVEKMDKLTGSVAGSISALGFRAYPIKSIAAALDHDRYRGPISLKHAAVLAGLGKIGKNTLLVNETFGNMIWLGAVVTDLPLESDHPAPYEVCPDTCQHCVEECPVSALGNDAMKQMTCFRHAFRVMEGQLEIHCWKCRQICPHHQGIHP